MGLIISTNISSLFAQRHLRNNTVNLTTSLERLASGNRINKAADDAAGLSISESLRSQIRGTQKAISNAQDGINILQIAEGALSVISDNLQRIRELSVQAGNDTYSSTERKAIASEVKARIEDITRIAMTTKGNNVNLLDGTSSSFLLQIGANADTATNTLSLGAVFQRSTATALGINTTATAAMRTGSSARNFLNEIDSALAQVFAKRSSLGAFQNRLESTVQNLNITTENLMATESAIRSIDIAAETSTMTKNQILQQASASVLAQANQIPNIALQLIQG